MACTGRASIDLTTANEIAKFIPFPRSQCQPNLRTGIALGTRLTTPKRHPIKTFLNKDNSYFEK